MITIDDNEGMMISYRDNCHVEKSSYEPSINYSETQVLTLKRNGEGEPGQAVPVTNYQTREGERAPVPPRPNI